MLRTYCLEFNKDWDEGVHLLLFAAREVVQESLGFSEAKLVFVPSGFSKRSGWGMQVRKICVTMSVTLVSNFTVLVSWQSKTWLLHKRK